MSTTTTESLKDIVVIYHADCTDGFGAAFAAWKKFKERASYIPAKNQTPPPEGLTGKELYILDYSYPKEVLEQLEKDNTSVVVIDHHQSAEEAVTAFPNNIFDLAHSGAVLAWQYFHPDVRVPVLLQYIEDVDLWNFKLSQSRQFSAALGQYPRKFSSWDWLVPQLGNKKLLNKFIGDGAIIAEYEDILVEKILAFREKVLFEGQEVYAINASRVYRSVLGNKLAELNEQEGGVPIGIVYYHLHGRVSVSLRSKGDTDVAAIAAKYGGGGHKHSASIKVADFSQLPFTFIEEKSNKTQL